jgi:hypothetical protein
MLSFPVHLYILLTAINICYSFTWLSLGASTSHTVSDSRLPQTWRATSLYLYPPGMVWPSYTPGKTTCPRYSPSTNCTENISSIIACFLVVRETTCLQSCCLLNGCWTVACLHSWYLAMGLRVTILTEYELDGCGKFLFSFMGTVSHNVFKIENIIYNKGVKFGS